MGHLTPAASLSSIQQRWQLGDGNHVCGELTLFSLNVDNAECARLSALLSGKERARATRFLSAVHGRRFSVAHGRLRQILAKPLGVAPEAIEFAAGVRGKPELAGVAVTSGLRFNLSHSGDVGLIGWSWNRQIGVDVEIWRAMKDDAALVRRFFSAVEITAWEVLPLGQRREAFFNLWTRKEAYVKALGQGLSLPLDSFDVSHQRGSGARLLRPSSAAGPGGPWSLAAPEVGDGLSLAVVLEAGVCHTAPEV